MPRRECRTNPTFQNIWGEELKKPLDYFPNTHGNKVKVCNQTYHCVRQGNESVWKRNIDKNDVLSGTPCKTDALYAMSYQNGCLASFKNGNSKCKRVEACLNKPNDDRLYCISKTSNGMPDVFPSNLTCNSTIPDPKKHEIVQETNYVGMKIVTLANKEHVEEESSDEENANDFLEEKSLPEAEQVDKNLLTGLSDPPGSSERESKNEKIPKAFKPPKNPDMFPTSKEPAKPKYVHPHANLKRCDFLFHTSQPVCSVNTDCMNDDSAFEVWWSNTVQNVKKGQRVKDLLEQ